MTKLTQWLFVLVLFLAVWLAMIFEKTPLKMSDQIQIWVYLVKL